ncbi:hypothetical protein BX666DRAFT_913663 [Dichotomocladium elegans]|nr:hypothetical protein BX666DRAFT_913663 [Dichotomocladium elegans]
MNNEAATYGGQYITPAMGVAGAVLIVIGLCLCFLGVRIPKLTAGITGFVIFGLITWTGLINQRPVGGYNSHDSVTMIVVPAGLGILGAGICIVLAHAATCLLGGNEGLCRPDYHKPVIAQSLPNALALGGLALALYILCWREDLVIANPIGRASFIAILPMMLAAVIWLEKLYVPLFCTSMSGAYAFMVGVDFLAHTGYLTGIRAILDGNHRMHYVLNPRIYALLSVTGVMCLIAMAWQLVSNRDSAPVADVKKADEEAEANADAASAPNPSA